MIEDLKGGRMAVIRCRFFWLKAHKNQTNGTQCFKFDHSWLTLSKKQKIKLYIQPMAWKKLFRSTLKIWEKTKKKIPKIWSNFSHFKMKFFLKIFTKFDLFSSIFIRFWRLTPTFKAFFSYFSNLMIKNWDFVCFPQKSHR